MVAKGATHVTDACGTHPEGCWGYAGEGKLVIAELKGTILRGVLRDAKENLPGGIDRLMQGVAPTIVETCFATNIIHGSWYSYEAFAALLEAYSKAPGFSGPDAFVNLGKRLAERDLTSLLKVYAMVASPVRLADVPQKVWTQRFRNAGSGSTEKGESSFRFTITGFPDIHRLHCELLTGYGLDTGLRKSKSFATVHDRCVHKGDAACSFLSSW